MPRYSFENIPENLGTVNTSGHFDVDETTLGKPRQLEGSMITRNIGRRNIIGEVSDSSVPMIQFFHVTNPGTTNSLYVLKPVLTYPSQENLSGEYSGEMFTTRPININTQDFEEVRRVLFDVMSNPHAACYESSGVRVKLRVVRNVNKKL